MKLFSKEDILNAADSYKTPLKRILLVVFALDVNTIIPFILYVLKNQNDEKERDKIFELLESYLLRRFVCNRSNNNYSDLFTESLIGRQIFTYDGLRQYLSSKKYTENLHMPYDIEVEECFRVKNIPNGKARGILYLLESKFRQLKKAETALLPYNDYTLEHLMPQAWETNWPTPEGLSDLERIEFKEKRDDIIKTLGNMAIISQSLNSQISNSKWSDKLNDGLIEKAGDLLTLKDVINKKVWNEETIEKRAKQLSTIANQVWKNEISAGEKEEKDLLKKEKAKKAKKQQVKSKI